MPAGVVLGQGGGMAGVIPDPRHDCFLSCLL